MALKGNLRDFSIIQLLNLVNLAKKTGALHIEGPGEKSKVVFRQGNLAYAELELDDNNLASVLRKSQIITKSQYNTIKKNASHMSDKELGLILINAGYITQADVIESLQNYYSGVLNQLFTWAEGEFEFESNYPVPSDKIPVKVKLENIIIEGTRNLQKWEKLHDEIPNLDIALRFTDGSGVNLKSVNLSVEEWKVASYINPKNTLSQIATATSKSDLEIRKIAYSLLQAGLVEFTRKQEEPNTQVEQKLPGLDKAMPGMPVNEQKKLVNKLIGRIRSI